MPQTTANPRLIDVFDIELTQEDVPFAIPRLHSDLPFCFDPFLLWSSEKPEYQALHTRLVDFFQHIAQLVRTGAVSKAAQLLAACAEPRELGLGYAHGSRRGNNIGPKLIASILTAFQSIPQLSSGSLRHLEELQLVVPGFAEDRTSDTAAALVRQFFHDFTQTQCALLGIPTRPVRLGQVFDSNRNIWIPAPTCHLPFNPVDSTPILFAPLDLLRTLPWINYDDYYTRSFIPTIAASSHRTKRVAKAAVLDFNARSYEQVGRYVTERESHASACRPTPLFTALSSATLRRKFAELRKLPTGSAAGADRQYEDLITSLLNSLLYPTLEFAESRVRTLSNTHIRDLIFYNDGKTEFFRDIRKRFDSRQPVFELKNVKSLDTEHVNQLYRYLDEEFGRFGVLVTRNPAPSNVIRNTVDLHSSKRVVIISLDDRDIEQMLAALDCDRSPSDVIKKKFIEFTRLLPK